MPNPARHDRCATVKKATQLFWEKGFHATSMRNLQEHIDMRPGSIYATFGSKEGLFKEALQYYAESGVTRLSEYTDAYASPVDALKHFMRDALQGGETAPSEMCMLVKTISELTEDNGMLLEEAKRLLGVMEGAFSAVLLKAQEQGELDRNRDVRRMARFLQMQLIGLRVYARANSDANIDELIDDVFECLSE